MGERVLRLSSPPPHSPVSFYWGKWASVTVRRQSIFHVSGDRGWCLSVISFFYFFFFCNEKKRSRCQNSMGTFQVEAG